MPLCLSVCFFLLLLFFETCLAMLPTQDPFASVSQVVGITGMCQHVRLYMSFYDSSNGI
jgi:hypothetical protein